MTDRKRILEMLAQGHSPIMIMQTIGATPDEIEEAQKLPLAKFDGEKVIALPEPEG